MSEEVKVITNSDANIDATLSPVQELKAEFNSAQSINADITNTSDLSVSIDNDSKDINIEFDNVYSVSGCKVLYNTTEYWNSRPSLVSRKGYLYVYSDWKTDEEGKNIAGIKVGDGSAYLIDMAFTDEMFADHIDDVVRHITEEEREFWNNKVRCYIEEDSPTNLIFTTK